MPAQPLSHLTQIDWFNWSVIGAPPGKERSAAVQRAIALNARHPEIVALLKSINLTTVDLARHDEKTSIQWVCKELAKQPQFKSS